MEKKIFGLLIVLVFLASLLMVGAIQYRGAPDPGEGGKTKPVPGEKCPSCECKEVAECQRELQECRTEYSKENDECEDELAAYRAELEQLKAENEQLKAENIEFRLIISSLRSEVRMWKEYAKEIERILNDLLKSCRR